MFRNVCMMLVITAYRFLFLFMFIYYYIVRLSFLTVNTYGHPNFWWSLTFSIWKLENAYLRLLCGQGIGLWPGLCDRTHPRLDLEVRCGRWHVGGNQSFAKIDGGDTQGHWQWRISWPPVLRVLGTEYWCSGVFLRAIPMLWLSIIPGCVASGFGFLALLEIPEICSAVSSVPFFFFAI